jgi:hypothetical protein
VESHYNYAAEIEIAADLRKCIPRQRAVLFHGTRFPCSILKTNCLVYHREMVDGGVSFTRLLHVGVYFARIGHPTGEEHGAVLVLDREKLMHDFSLRPFCWRKLGWDKSRGDFEAEEIIFGRDIPNLHRYILDALWLPKSLCKTFAPQPLPVNWFELLNLIGVKGAQKPMNRHKPEEIVTKLRKVEIMVSQGEQLAGAIHEVGVSDATYNRWRQDYGRLTIKARKPGAAYLPSVFSAIKHKVDDHLK